MLGLLVTGAAKVAGAFGYGLNLFRGFFTGRQPALDVVAGQPVQGGDVPYQNFALGPATYRTVPAQLLGRSPLTSVVTLVLWQKELRYNGTRPGSSRRRLKFATGVLVKGNPRQVVTAAQNLWRVDPVHAVGRVYSEWFTTSIMAIACDTFATLTPLQQRSFVVLRQRGGQYVKSYQTAWPNPDQLSHHRVFTMGASPDHLNIAILHVRKPLRAGRHLKLFPVPVTIQPSPGMRFVVFGHTDILNIEPNYYARAIPPAGITFSSNFLDLPTGGGNPEFSGGPLCIPPEATVSGRGLIAAGAPAGAPPAWRLGAINLGVIVRNPEIVVRRFRPVDQNTITSIVAGPMCFFGDLKAYAAQYRVLPPFAAAQDPYRPGTRLYYQSLRKLDTRGPAVS